MMDKIEIEKYMQQFSQEYGLLIGLRANLAAINKMLIKRGRDQELFDTIELVIDNYKKKVRSDNVEIEIEQK